MTSPSAKILGGRDAVRACIAQVSPVFMNRDASVVRAAEIIAQAGAEGADLVVFPEAWLSGYPYWTEGWESPLGEWVGGRTRFFDEAILVPSAATDAIGRAAATAGVHVVMGCNEIDPRPGVQTIYNTLLFFDDRGTLIGRHRKLMPTFTERLFWGAGDASDLEVYETSLGRLGGLICGEHLMTPLRAAMIAMGEDIHVAAFPGSFALHTGPRLEEWDMNGDFWGHFVTRSHAMEGGCFTLCACAMIDPADVPDDLPVKDRLHVDYARGGSQIVTPLGVLAAGPTEGKALVHGTLEAWMIKAVKAIVDTGGHYARPDVARTQLRRDSGWATVGAPYAGGRMQPPLDAGELRRAADRHEVEEDRVREVADARGLHVAGTG